MLESSPRRISPLFRAIGVACAIATFSISGPVALAQSGDETEAERKERARQLFREGQGYAEAGRYEMAVEKWLQAYEVEPVALFLFNIAQAYRQVGRCSSALYFYERFLADELDSEYAEVAAGHAEQLASQCEPQPPWPEDGPQPDESGDDEPESVDPEPGPETADPDPEPQPQPAAPEPAPGPAEPISPTRFAAFAEAGPAFASLGELQQTTLVTVRAGVGYPVAVGPVEVQAGAATTFTPVPWSRSGESGTALLTGLMANAAVRYPVVPKLFARGDVGVGALLFSGIDHEHSIFIEPGLTATGALGMFHVRAQVSAEYELTPNLVASVAPIAFSFSPPAAGLRSDIGALTRFEVLAGISVRL